MRGGRVMKGMMFEELFSYPKNKSRSGTVIKLWRLEHIFRSINSRRIPQHNQDVMMFSSRRKFLLLSWNLSRRISFDATYQDGNKLPSRFEWYLHYESGKESLTISSRWSEKESPECLLFAVIWGIPASRWGSDLSEQFLKCREQRDHLVQIIDIDLINRPINSDLHNNGSLAQEVLGAPSTQSQRPQNLFFRNQKEMKFPLRLLWKMKGKQFICWWKIYGWRRANVA